MSVSVRAVSCSLEHRPRTGEYAPSGQTLCWRRGREPCARSRARSTIRGGGVCIDARARGSAGMGKGAGCGVRRSWGQWVASCGFMCSWVWL